MTQWRITWSNGYDMKSFTSTMYNLVDAVYEVCNRFGVSQNMIIKAERVVEVVS